MEPQIQYVRAADGVSIGYWAEGAGRPLVYVTNLGFAGTIEVLAEAPAVRANLLRLAQRRRLVIYDHRGQGFSERDIEDFSLESRLLDLEAVVARSCDGTPDLLAVGPMATVALAFACRHPESARRIILSEPLTGTAEASPQRRALGALIEVDWLLYVQVITLLEFGWTEAGKRAAEVRLRAMSREAWKAALAAFRSYDMGPYVSATQVPTLIIHRRLPFERWWTLNKVMQLVGDFPNARLVLIDLDQPLVMAAHETVDAIDAFLSADATEANAKAWTGGSSSGLGRDHGGVGPGVAARIREIRNLTAREREVLGLVADGLSSREVADRLVLSVRTVERHISSIYSKLGVHSRAQVMATLFREARTE